MGELVLALDLGTGSCKASVWHPDGRCLASAVRPYATRYDGAFHEQRLSDWWGAIVDGVREVIGHPMVRADAVGAIAVSGHSLGLIGLDESGVEVRDVAPIWSDARGAESAARAFARLREAEWYSRTGNGFPAALYPVFKMGWYAQHDPEFVARTSTVVGCKDWVNARLTGRIATDPSYASGSGAWDLEESAWSGRIADAAGFDPGLWPEVVPATSIIGNLTEQAASALGLSRSVLVTAGGVDNSCMSAGSRSVRAGTAFMSLGSSSWFVATTEHPIIDVERRPYTFASLVSGLYDSVLSSFSAGISLRWIRTLLGGGTPVDDEAFVRLAKQSVPGARGLRFLPMLTGGAPHEGGPDARGALLGLDSEHTASDIARAAFEGTAFAVARAGKALRSLVGIPDELTVSGGGSRSDWVRQLYADALGRKVVATSVDQQAAALGAASTAFVATGVWESMADSDRAHHIIDVHEPQDAHLYEELVAGFDADMAEYLTKGTQ